MVLRPIRPHCQAQARVGLKWALFMLGKTLQTPAPKRRSSIVFRLLGPGLVTGAADDDPSGIATYSQAGSQFGYGLLSTVFLTTPFMIAIQLVRPFIGHCRLRALTMMVHFAMPATAHKCPASALLTY